MLRNQWNDLFRDILSPEFTLRPDSTCYADEYFGLFTIHYGREKSVIWMDNNFLSGMFPLGMEEINLLSEGTSIE